MAEIVNLAIKNSGSFHSYVKLPEGILVDDRRLVFTSDKCDKLGFARLDNYFLN